MDLAQYNTDLKKVQVKYDEQINKLINILEEQALRKQYDYKECEEVARQAGRLTNRWRKITSLCVETFTEYGTEIKIDKQKIESLEKSNLDMIRFTETLNNENENLTNLVSVMGQIISSAEEERLAFGR